MAGLFAWRPISARDRSPAVSEQAGFLRANLLLR